MSADVLIPVAFAVPLLGAALIAAVARVVPRIVTDLLATSVAAVPVAALTALAIGAVRAGTAVTWFGGWSPRRGVALGIAFVGDPAATALALFAALLVLAAILFAWNYYEEESGTFHALVLVFDAALIGMFLTGDLFTLFVCFELLSVSAFALTGYRSEDDDAVLGAITFAVINSAGAFVTLIGIALVYGRTGALNLAQLAHDLAGGNDPLVALGCAFVLMGFLVKAAIVPFQFWLSEAHAVAPTPLCMLFSGIMVETGLYAVARILSVPFAGPVAAHAAAVRDVLLGLGLLTAALGATMIFAQRHLKRLLAFSTISHSGILLCAIALGTPRALGGFFAYVIGHGLIKAGLFGCSGIVLNRFGSLDLEALRGRLRELPLVAALLALGALGLAGMPPFGTFLGKGLIDDAAHEAGLAWLAPALLVPAACTGGAILAAVVRLWFGWGAPLPPGGTPAVERPENRGAGPTWAMFALAAILVAIAGAVGLVDGAAGGAAAAAARFLDRDAFVAVVLDGRTTGPVGAAPPLPLGLAVAWGSAGAVLAALLAWWAAARRSAGPLDLVVHGLRALHRGVVTDEVAWLAAGVVAIGALFLMTGM